MVSNKRDAASLWDMVQAIRDLQAFTAGLSYENYISNLMVQRAVERQLEILGEAARRVSQDFCQSHPEIDWTGIIGLRNVLAHRYDQIRCDRIWAILDEELPLLLTRLEQLLPPLPDNSSFEE
ncbi:MAG: HepT-like ribonuclease domain-containing protein [Elainellaceae cyanobacterium]